MSLEISKLVTRCHASRARQAAAGIVDVVARSRFGTELAQRLGPSLSGTAVVRIRRLPVHVRIPAAELRESTLVEAWLVAFTRALFEALAYPPGAGPLETVRADSRPQFLAMALRDIAAERGDGWQYSEFEHHMSGGGPAAMVAILRAEPSEMVATLAELAEMRALEEVVARWDDRLLEEVFSEIGGFLAAGDSPLSVADLLAAGRVALASPPPRGWRLDARRYALWLFVASRKTPGPLLTPRRTYHALLALTCLLESPRDADFLADGGPSPHAARAGAARWLPPAVSAFFATMGQGGAGAVEIRSAGRELLQMLEALRPLVPSAAQSTAVNNAAAEHWVRSDVAGVFLLASLVEPRDLDRVTLAGIALSAVGRFDPRIERLDAAVALFAGFTAEPDMAAVRAAFGSPGRAAELDGMAERLTLQFGARVRGFRKATRQAISRQFLARPGRIRIGNERISVVLAPNPFHIALHICGMDASVERIPWLAGRRIEFHLEGL